MKCVTKSWRSSPWARIARSAIVFAVQWAIAVAARLEIVAAGRAAHPVHHDPGRACCRVPGAAVRARGAAARPGCATSWRPARSAGRMLFMWLLEGQPEAQFHVFVSLAFLAFYRDWRVLADGDAHRHRLSDRAARAAARLLRDRRVGLVARVRPGRLGGREIAVIMLLAVLQSLKTVQKFATHAATLCARPTRPSASDVEERTRELARSREQYRLIAETTRAIPFELDLAHGRFTYIGPQAQKMLGFPEARWKEPGFLDVLLPRAARGRACASNSTNACPALSRRCARVVTADDRVRGAALDGGLRARSTTCASCADS